MTNLNKKVDIQKIISLGDDLIGVLGNKKDINCFIQSIEGENAIHSACKADAQELQGLLIDYQKKIDVCKERIEQEKKETLEDAGVELLQNKLEAKLREECMLHEELRIVAEELDDLEHQRISIQERKEIIRKREKDNLKAQNLLSMCASVTNILPNLDDQRRISGVVVDKNRKKANVFEFDPSVSSFEVCSRLWEMK